MINKTLTLPCNIGDRAFIVSDYNRFLDFGKYYKTKYGTKVKMEVVIVKAFIIDEEGISVVESSPDGYDKLTDKDGLTLDSCGECKVFFSESEAMSFIDSISKSSN